MKVDRVILTFLRTRNYDIHDVSDIQHVCDAVPVIQSNQNETTKTIRDEYAERTRTEILKSARSIFTKTGFAASSLQQIAKSAGVTRGALYHHFKNKEDIFLAVFRILQAEMIEKLGRTVSTEIDDGWIGVSAVLSSFLEYSQNVEYQQIVLIEGPGALGWAQWRKVEEEYALGFIGDLIDHLTVKGEIITANRDALASMVMGLTIESSLALAMNDGAYTAADIQQIAERMVFGLKAD
ncbi:MAG: TetR/AcrR family transcriptional regulator [Rhodobiaceae bacterium]|nr:TetR/AcrR family transcriptional regulator [Rhodobiaceae bacterium]